MNSPLPEDITFPCGCTVVCRCVQGENVMVVQPCQRGCAVAARMLAEIEEAGKPIEYRRF